MFGLGALQKLPLWAGLLFAAGLVGATFCLRAGLGLYAGDPPLLILFVVPILVGAYLGGGKTGLAATAAAGLSSNYFLLESFRSLAIIEPVHQVEWGLLWLIGIAASLSAEGLIRSIRQEETGRGRTEAELAWSVSLFPEENPFPVLRAGRDGKLLYANRAAEGILAQWQCSVGSSVPEPVRQELTEALKGGNSREMEINCGDRFISLVLVPIAGRHYVNFYGRDLTDRKRAEEELRESERRYRAIGESIDYGVWVCAADGRNIYASESFLKMVGITQQQCSDFGWGEVLHPDDSERTIAAWKQCVRTGGTWDIEHRFRGADGQWHAVLARGVPVKNEKGDVVCWAGINLDISRLKRAEQELQNAHERLVTILDGISDGFFSLDSQWRVTAINEKGAQLIGQTRETMLGRVLWEVFPEAIDSDFERAYQRAMAERLTTTTESFYAPLNAWFEARAYPSGDGISVFFRDVTDRKRFEQALRESQADLTWAQAVGQIGSWRLDVQRNELLWSDENHRIFGVPKGTPLTYETFLGIVHPEDREFVDRRWTAALRGEPYDIEHRIVVGRTLKWVRERAELEFDDHGRLRGGFGITQDITTRKESEQALRDSEEALRKANSGLEEKVRRRTGELEETVAMLKIEILERNKIQTQLHQLSRVFMDAADPIIIEDLSGKVVEMNREAERSYGYSRQELIGSTITALFIPERHDQAMQMRERCRAGEEIRNWEGVRKAKNGRIIPSLVTAFPLVDESSRVAYVATISKDISERKQMEAMLMESQLHLKELSRKSLEALEAERRTVARELHDSIGGSLAAIKFGLEETVERSAKNESGNAALLEAIVSHIAETIKETRRISANLRPLMLDDLGMLATIEWYTRQIRQSYGHIRLIRQIDVQEHEIPEEFKIVFYRVLQEAVNNAVKHSRADTIHIRFRKRETHFELEVEDNGSGFDLGEAFSRQDRLSGFGLKSMQERAEICGGVLNIHTQPGEGTCVKVTLAV